MGYSVQTLLNDIAGVSHGTTTNKIPNISGAINRAARAVLLDVDPKETTRIISLAQIFNDVYDYPIPADVKGDRIIDLRPQAGRLPGDIFVQDYSQQFDSMKSLGLGNAITTQWNTGVKTLRVEADTITQPTTVCDTSTITGWAATTGASSISLDTLNNVAGAGDIVFNLAAGQPTGYIENSSLTPIDLTAGLNKSTLFMWVFLPVGGGAAVTSIDLRWGTNSTNYWHYTATATQQGTAFADGWNLVAFPWASATQVGSPTVTLTEYLRVTLAYNSTLQTGVAICNLTSNLGYIFQLVYYSKYLFRSAGGAFQETIDITNGTDTSAQINLDTESYNLLFNKTAFFIAQSLQGADAAFDQTVWAQEYTNALTRYRAMYPSEATLKAQPYYTGGRRRPYGSGTGIWPH